MATNKTYVRSEMYLLPETAEKLRYKAFRERRPMAEIIREIVEHALQNEPAPENTKTPSP